MGNNHNKYFGQNKRKILILGLSTSGKTSNLPFFFISIALLRILKGDEKKIMGPYVPTELFNNEQVIFKTNLKGPESMLEFDVWDLGGKLPHIWVHHFVGT